MVKVLRSYSTRYRAHLARLKAEAEGVKLPPKKRLKKCGPKTSTYIHSSTPTRKATVKRCREIGLTIEQIEHIMGCDRVTLTKHYREQLDVGLAEGVRQVADTVFAAASDPEHKDWARKSEFYLKTVGKWSETTGVEISAPGGGPLQIEHKPAFDSRLLSMEDRQALRQILQRALPNPNVTDAEYEEVTPDGGDAPSDGPDDYDGEDLVS